MEVKFYWCKSGGSDKVWGYFLASDTLYNFWGKRGAAKLAFQQHPISKQKTFRTKADGKLRKGYKEVEPANYDTVWPDFEHEVQHQLLIAKLGDDFRYQSE